MNNKAPLIIIPARGGSKGVPGKNIKLLNGKPLIEHTIDVARKISIDQNIIVSTDDILIKECVEKTGLKVPFLRPNALATDTAPTYDVLLHSLDYFEKTFCAIDTIILLQATTPFRTAKHVEEALNLYDESVDMVVSVKETGSNPYYVLFEEDNNGWLKKSKDGEFTSRQQCPKVWELNGGIYIINTKKLKEMPLNRFQNIKKYVMDDWSSHDIDTALDWELAELLARKINL